MNRKLVSVGLGAVLFLQAVSASAALNAHLQLSGQKQGKFQGSSTQKKAAINVIAFTHDPTPPRDLASASGMRMHKPMVITIETDAATKVEFTP